MSRIDIQRHSGDSDPERDSATAKIKARIDVLVRYLPMTLQSLLRIQEVQQNNHEVMIHLLLAIINSQAHSRRKIRVTVTKKGAHTEWCPRPLYEQRFSDN